MLTALMLAAALGSPVRQDTASQFRWTGTLPAGATLEVRGVIGSIRADAASGREISVRSREMVHGSDIGAM